ncbi:SBBP repeat-containing protein [Limisphaera sp. VF-2]|uniref:DUF7948 domain-containing protein n=1 Tax=Limisphaera sp. VF-2 TaxID=3400418 RepID=UPI003C2718EF
MKLPAPGSDPIPRPPAGGRDLARGLLIWWVATVAALGLTPGGPAGTVQLPFYFERNVGQVEARYAFVAQGRAALYLVAADEVAVALVPPGPVETAPSDDGRTRSTVPPRAVAPARWVRLHWVGANPQAPARALDPLPGRVHYLLGNRPDRWRLDVPLTRAVRFEQVYRGVDVVYYASDRQLEMDFVLAPGANPAGIEMRIEGAEEVRVEANGDLVVRVAGLELRQHRPVAYQHAEGGRREIECAFELRGARRVGFRLGLYDPSLPLTIDPVFRYASYFGGAGGDVIWAVAADATGAVYVAGETTSATALATAGAFQTNYGGGTAVGGDAFVAKLTPSGSNLVYLTYLGGRAHDAALALAVDSAGAVYLTGFTASSNFPTVRALQAAIGGQPDPALGVHPLDAFVAKLSPEGDRVEFSTFFGGSGLDEGIGLAVDTPGRIYLTGLTDSTNLPVVNAFQPVPAGGRDGFVAQLTADGQGLGFSTYLGGSGLDYGSGVAVDREGRVWITGLTQSTNFWVTNAIQARINDPTGLATNVNTMPDAFVTRLSSEGAPEFSTFLGGTFSDVGFRIVTDVEGNAYVAGSTESIDFPVTITNLTGTAWTNRALADVFVTKIDGRAPTGWVYSVAFGGRGRDEAWDLAVDRVGRVHLIGVTGSTNFPVMAVPSGGSATLAGRLDAFLAGLDPRGGALEYAFYYGGSGEDYGYALALDPAGHLWIAGTTTSTNLWTERPLQPVFAGGPGDAFLARLLQPPALQIRLAGPGLVELFWPAPSHEWELFRALPDSAPVWESVGPAPAPVSGFHRIELGTTNGPAWFRLQLR